MKKLLFSLTALTLSTVLFAQETQKPVAATTATADAQKKKAADVAKFKTETIDLGKLQQGNPTTATFSVVNIGSEPLIIEQANPTCGCTISNYTKEPIAANKAGEIKATYNAANIGAFEKHLTVKFAGVDEIKSITIKGEVLSKEDYAKLNGGTTAPAAEKAPAPATSTDAKAKPVVKEETKSAKAKPAAKKN